MQGTSESIKYRFDFLKYRYIWLFISIAYLVIGFAAYFIKGGFKYHIDFTGGAELRLSFEKPLEIARLRKVISDQGWHEAVIQEVGSAQKDFLIRIAGDLDTDLEPKIRGALAQHITDNNATINNIDKVGAEVSNETTWNAIKAVILSLLVLLLYIAVRFEFRFGIGAVASLIHDVLAVLVFLLLTGEQMSLHVLASILAVLGYSINDTIVIFSRIKENMIKHRGMSEYDIANLSINQTLRRTLLTSFATLLSVIAILILGGEPLRGLSLVMFIGIIIGTYSSIYIASPSMLAVKSKNG